ncbi:DUF2283 domain-containing protein [Candidatus Roizmanbacteria bacterium]|nr:DUF2283 domain-containing protein [Candidatus Roizmanbacteria bacterium]
MKITYDPVSDAMYIYFSKKRKSARTEEVSEDILVDYAGKELVGIEILNVSQKLPKRELDRVALTPA